MSVPAWLTRYHQRGFRLLFYPSKSKGPSGPAAVGWTTRNDKPEDYADGLNVGVFTGVEIQSGRFLVDIDFDWPEGLALRELLPPTSYGFGRKSRPVSHALYTDSTALTSLKFTDIDGKTFVELRCAKADGSIGFQTMAPPSVHPSGEVIELRADGDIAHTDALPRAITLYALGCMLLAHLGPRGLLHEARMAMAGFLLQSGLSEDEVLAVGRAVAKATQNSEGDVETAVRSTAARIRNHERVKGRTALVTILGDNGKEVCARIRQWLGANDTEGIVMRPGQLSEVVNKAEAALLAAHVAIYQRGGVLTRAIKLDKPIGDSPQDVRRDAGSTILVEVWPLWLVEQMALAAPWFRGHANGETVPADPDPKYAYTLQSRGEWRFPVLRGVITAPTLARDGRVIASPGFDADSGLLLDMVPGSFPSVPAEPTQDEARAALARLAYPLRGFPFVDDVARAVALSAMLTVLVRPSLRTAPLHGYDAPTAGTGKSLLAEMVGLLALGCRPPALSQGKCPEEDEKRLATVLFAGDPVIHIDNCERAIAGDFLCSLLTQEIVQARILGLSERRVLPTTALVLASGNNLTFSGDASRRAVICRLDAGVERPDTRVFDFDCGAEVLSHRPELVVAGLTILRAYHIAGRPVKLTPMGSFNDFEWVRGALVWLGEADPADTRESILDNDPKKDELLSVMELWGQLLGGDEIEVAEIGKRDDLTELRERLTEVACRGSWSAKSIGWWLRRYKDRVVGGRCFRCEHGANGQRWSLAGERRALPLDEGELRGSGLPF